MGKILFIGDNSLLLASYTAVLTSLGRPVVVCNSSDCIRLQLRKNQIDLVIVCSTVPDRSRRTIISDAFARWPRPRVLQIVAAEECTHSVFRADGYVSAADPHAVIGRARAILAEHSPPPHTLEPERVKPQAT